jgi:hypothetical protein
MVVLEVAFRRADGLRFELRICGGNLIEERLQVLGSDGLWKSEPEGEDGGEGSHCLPPHRSMDLANIKFTLYE